MIYLVFIISVNYVYLSLDNDNNVLYLGSKYLNSLELQYREYIRGGGEIRWCEDELNRKNIECQILMILKIYIFLYLYWEQKRSLQFI